jgi:hypothetical protein
MLSRGQLVGAIEQRLEIGSQCLGDSKKRVELRICGALFQFLQMSHGETCLMCNFFLGCLFAKRRSPLADGDGKVACEARSRWHECIVWKPRRIDHGLQTTFYGSPNG